MEDETGAAVADSPAAETSSADPSAGTQNTGITSQPEKLTPFNQHPDWKRMVGERNESRAALTRSEQRAQALEQRLASLEGKATATARTPEEAFQRQQAGSALKELIAEHPELKPLLDLAKQAPHLLKGYEGVQELSRAQQDAQYRQATQYIGQAADKANLPADAKFRTRLTRLIAHEVSSMPEGKERVERGDYAVFDEALATVRGEFLGQVTRPAAATLLETKNNLQRLPPASNRGGAGGREAPPSLKPGQDAKEFRRDMFARGRQALAESVEG